MGNIFHKLNLDKKQEWKRGTVAHYQNKSSRQHSSESDCLCDWLRDQRLALCLPDRMSWDGMLGEQ